MAGQQVESNFFTWVISTIMTAIFTVFGWLGIHTRRINELSTKIALLNQSHKNLTEDISEIKTNIKNMRSDQKSDMSEIRNKWDNQIDVHNKSLLENQKLASVLISQSESLKTQDGRIELIEKNVNFKVSKK